MSGTTSAFVAARRPFHYQVNELPCIPCSFLFIILPGNRGWACWVEILEIQTAWAVHFALPLGQSEDTDDSICWGWNRRKVGSPRKTSFCDDHDGDSDACGWIFILPFPGLWPRRTARGRHTCRNQVFRAVPTGHHLFYSGHRWSISWWFNDSIYLAHIININGTNAIHVYHIIHWYYLTISKTMLVTNRFR